jgi:gluconolactonase
VLHTFGTDGRTAQRGIDGMCLDREGNIIATAGNRLAGPGPLIYVFSPNGRVIETHPVPCDMPTNCCFGGPDRSTLYLTSANGHFFKAQTDLEGRALFP